MRWMTWTTTEWGVVQRESGLIDVEQSSIVLYRQCWLPSRNRWQTGPRDRFHRWRTATSASTLTPTPTLRASKQRGIRYRRLRRRHTHWFREVDYACSHRLLETNTSSSRSIELLMSRLAGTPSRRIPWTRTPRVWSLCRVSLSSCRLEHSLHKV